MRFRRMTHREKRDLAARWGKAAARDAIQIYDDMASETSKRNGVLLPALTDAAALEDLAFRSIDRPGERVDLRFRAGDETAMIAMRAFDEMECAKRGDDLVSMSSGFLLEVALF